MKTVEQRADRFLKMMLQATEATGVTYAVQHGEPIVLFDLVTEKPLEATITRGTEILKGQGKEIEFKAIDRTEDSENEHLIMKRSELWNMIFNEDKTADDYSNEIIGMKVNQGTKPNVGNMSYALNELEKYFDEEIEI